MDYGVVKNLMRQQLSAVKELDKLLYEASNQGIPNTVAQKDMDILIDHVLHLKNICETVTALADHFHSSVAPKSTKEKPEIEAGEDTVRPDEAVKKPEREKKTKAQKVTGLRN